MFDLSFIYDLIAQVLPWEWAQARFMQQALVGLLILSPMCAAMGVQVVNLRMAFFSDAISHSAFTGIAVGLLLSLDSRIAMLGIGLLVGVSITALGRHTSLSSDTVIGVFFSGAIAFGLAVVSRDPSVANDFQRVLYGDILTIGDAEILWMFVFCIILLAFQIIGFNKMLYIGLNPSLAMAHRVSVSKYQYCFAGLLSIVVVFLVWAVGVLLVTAMLIIPAASARHLARSARSMFWIAQVIAMIASVSGLCISAQAWANTATGATIILCLCAFFILSLCIAKIKH